MTATAATEFTPQGVADFMRRHGCSEFYVQHYLRTMGRTPKEIDMTISHSILAAAKAGERAVESTQPASTPRLCKDCKHAEAGAGVWMCGHPKLLIMDYVVGKHTQQHCATLRKSGHECNPSAAFWEAE